MYRHPKAHGAGGCWSRAVALVVLASTAAIGFEGARTAERGRHQIARRGEEGCRHGRRDDRARWVCVDCGVWQPGTRRSAPGRRFGLRNRFDHEGVYRHSAGGHGGSRRGEARRGERLAIDANFPRRWSIEGANEVQQCGLAGSGGADDGDAPDLAIATWTSFSADTLRLPPNCLLTCSSSIINDSQLEHY